MTRKEIVSQIEETLRAYIKMPTSGHRDSVLEQLDRYRDAFIIEASGEQTVEFFPRRDQ